MRGARFTLLAALGFGSAPSLSRAEEPVTVAAEPVTVDVRGERRNPTRGTYDLTLQRDLLEASPRLQTSEMLSAAPGFFVDHEDGEGLGNDVFLRGFDLSHGSGIEMLVGGTPINIPAHVRGQGYADVNFLIPEVVRSVRVLEGPYDPRQGDAAIVGSADFELGLDARGYQSKVSYGSFDQLRFVGIAAPPGFDEGTFLAFAGRKTDGFGARRDARSGTLNAQYVAELGPRTKLRVLAVAHGARATLPGVVREDDVRAGRIGFYDSYPYFAERQSIASARVLASAELSHEGARGARFVFAPWAMWTELRARENYTGVIETSELDPSVSARGDLFETDNVETAVGARASYRAAPRRLGSTSALTCEPGLVARAGFGEQSKSLVDPTLGSVWDRRLDAGLVTVDAAGYLDADLIVSEALSVSGGMRADVLVSQIDDRLIGLRRSERDRGSVGEQRNISGVALSPRIAVQYRAAPGLDAQAAYGEGFRSLPVAYLEDGMDRPFSKVRSAELGMSSERNRGRWSSRLAVFQTWVENEVVFVANEGGLATQNRSVRRGVVGSFVLRPVPFLLASSSFSVTRAEYETRVPGISHHVPNVPPLLLRTDVSVRGTVVEWGRRAVTGRFGLGYTFLSSQHLSEIVVGPVTHLLNVGGAVRYGALELGLDVYDVFSRENADNADFYASNWSLEPGQALASNGTHLTAAPPRTVVMSATAYF